jgi:hypothetical protein
MVEGGETLFGARHESVAIVREPDGAARWTPHERTFGEFAPATLLEGEAGQLRASFYLQTLTPVTGTPLLYAGARVAATHNVVGAGAAVLLGTFAGLSATAHINAGADELFLQLLASTGVQPDSYDGLQCRRRVYGQQEALFLINGTSELRIARIPLDGSRQMHDLLGTAITAYGDDFVSVQVPAANIVCLVKSGDGVTW